MDYWTIIEDIRKAEEIERRQDDRNNIITPPSDVPKGLPTVSEEAARAKGVFLTPREA